MTPGGTMSEEKKPKEQAPGWEEEVARLFGKEWMEAIWDKASWEELEVMWEKAGHNVKALERMKRENWHPLAPVNRGPKGEWFRKTWFPWGEWMWLRVESLEDRKGLLVNDSSRDPALAVGALVTFRLYPEGVTGGPVLKVEEVEGDPARRFAAAVSWDQPPTSS